MKDLCDLCTLNCPTSGCTKLSHESCLKEAIQSIKPSVYQKGTLRMKKSDFIKKIERAKKYSDKSSQLVDEIIDELEEDGVNINAYVMAPNSDNVADSITCYVQYDEWTPEEIWQAIKDILIGEEK